MTMMRKAFKKMLYDIEICVKSRPSDLYLEPVMMKFSVKHGLGLLAGIFLSATAMASEPVPIEDRDAFEKQYLECFMSGLKDKCFLTLFSNHFDFGFEDRKEILNRLESAFTQHMLECLPYNIYTVDKVTRGGVFDGRTYLIECSNRNFVGVQIIFRMTKDQWHVSNMNIGDTNEFLQKILNYRAN
jgi:hypothetical protein